MKHESNRIKIKVYIYMYLLKNIVCFYVDNLARELYDELMKG